MATIVCKQGNANSAEHPHIIWLHAIQDTRRHDILSEVPASPNVGSAIPHAMRRDRMTEASGQKRHWKHRLDGVSSALMPTDANGPHGTFSHSGNRMRVTARACNYVQERRPGTNSNELNTA
jgi:hypothetical protein